MFILIHVQHLISCPYLAKKGQFQKLNALAQDDRVKERQLNNNANFKEHYCLSRAFPDTWNYYLRLAYVKDLYASRYGDLKYHLRMHVK